MDVSKEAVKSKLKISDDIMITIARLAALDVKGVAGLGGEINKMSRLRKNGPIKINMMSDVAAIDIRIKVKWGEKARTVALDVQNAVKENIQNMTGVTVARVNVTISGVVFE
ncbi:MAG TPA: Asp23/Gls24 family envelope stress response protein [Ruminococcus sp.]|nr:Asp23/Gls24 family envelope stress response protein [Ruminococcus sp.]